MEAAMHSVTSGIPVALIIWLTLIALSAGAFAVLARIAYSGPSRREPSLAGVDLIPPRRGGPDPVRPGWNSTPTPTSEVTDARRYADEIATAAGRAGVTAVQRRGEWLRAQQVMDAAWILYENADSATRRAWQTAAFPVLATPLTPTEYIERERYLHRAAYEAHLRGALSTDQLMDALSHREGFDPALHPCQQDAVLARAARDRMLALYQNAAVAERDAWHGAELAAAAKRSLDNEAFRANVWVRDAQQRQSTVDSPWRGWIGRLAPADFALR
jgi:hypothetical protein